MPVSPSQNAQSRWPSLYVQVLFAIGLAVLLGSLRPAWGMAMQPFGDGFVRLIKMLIAPVVFATLVVGIAA
ncbi:MAG TPA: cation:dicarboxylase symporter family transporter [Polyangiaceae bacterium]